MDTQKVRRGPIVELLKRHIYFAEFVCKSTQHRWYKVFLSKQDLTAYYDRVKQSWEDLQLTLLDPSTEIEIPFKGYSNWNQEHYLNHKDPENREDGWFYNGIYEVESEDGN